jgi:hypothetical protein
MLVRVAIAIALSLLPTALQAQAEKRIALLIGNRDYKAGVGALTNPLNDIRIVGEALKAVGFDVLKPVENAQRSAMLIAIHAFAAKLKTAGPDAVGFLYYSGHGIASAGENYLIPTDLDEPSTVLLSVQGVKQSEVLAILRGEAPNAAHYLVLDACRNTLQGARGGKGFVPVGQQSGVLVAFATEPGKTATDVGRGSGPYATALAAELVKPAQSDLIMFHNVRVAVMDKTNGDQVPWTEDGIQRRQRVMFGGGGISAHSPQPSKGSGPEPLDNRHPEFPLEQRRSEAAKKAEEDERMRRREIDALQRSESEKKAQMVVWCNSCCSRQVNSEYHAMPEIPIQACRNQCERNLAREVIPYGQRYYACVYAGPRPSTKQ